MIASLAPRSWSLAFLARYWQVMSLPSAFRCRSLMLREARGQAKPRLIRLRMSWPSRGDLWLREGGTDYATFHAICINELYRPVRQYLPTCDYVLDLGANVGCTSLYLAAAYPACRILAVEPDPDNLELLRRNLAQLVAADRCRVLAGALWDRDGEVVLAAAEGSCFDAVRVDAAAVPGAARTVRAYTLASLLAESGFPRIDLLKADIEGAEVEMFRGDVSWLERVRTLAIEFHQDSRQRSGFDAVMARFGFQVDDAHPHTVVAHRTLP